MLSNILSFGLLALVAARQQPLAPFKTASISTLSAEEHSSFAHPSFPDHSLRIKKTNDFCDPTVNVYTGYLDVAQNSKHLFFWFFESRRDPATDDVLMWINGGPGGSSAFGAFMELGPCTVPLDPKLSPNGTLWNPYSWNSRTNMFFVDQPVGVGFSYADYGQTVTTTPDAAKDIQAFISLFFEVFDEYKGRAFHMAGESYGGRYIPVFAGAVWDGNRVAEKEGRTPINLQSVLIGNGWTNQYKFFPSYVEHQCTTVSGFAPVQPIDQCVHMKLVLPRCEKMIKKNCVDSFDSINCAAAFAFCDDNIVTPLFAIGTNPYDVRGKCDPDGVVCYKEAGRITEWLNSNATRKTLGVDYATVPNFSMIGMEVNRDFALSGDQMVASDEWVAQLLERGVKVLIYVGTTDFICNWVGNYAWTETLDWTGGEEYGKTPLRDWSLSKDSAVLGKTKSARSLSFLTLYEAGHMMPYDRPVESLEMLHRWLNSEEF